MINIKKIFLTLFFIFSLSQIITATINKERMVINPGSVDSVKYLIGWHSNIKARDLYNWGKSNGAVLIYDRGPIVDNIAGFVSDFGSKVIISGLKSDSFYHVIIDFVSFKHSSDADFLSNLKIFVSNKNFGRRLVKIVDYKNVLKGKPVTIDIPYEYSVNGDFELIFGDYSEENGLWGIWDIIVSEKQRILKNSEYKLKNIL